MCSFNFCQFSFPTFLDKFKLNLLGEKMIYSLVCKTISLLLKKVDRSETIVALQGLAEIIITWCFIKLCK